jgi:hypothetical protein
MELLLGIDLANLSSNIHLAQYFFHFTHLLLELSEDWSAFECATNTGIPVSAMLS